MPKITNSYTIELVSTGRICFANPGRLYVIYIPPGSNGKAATITNLDNKSYGAQWFNPSTGEYTDIADGPSGLCPGGRCRPSLIQVTATGCAY